MSKTATVDPKSYDLARHFYPNATEEQLSEVACDIQSAVESHSNLDDPTPWCLGCGAKTQDKCHCGPIADNE